MPWLAKHTQVELDSLTHLCIESRCCWLIKLGYTTT